MSRVGLPVAALMLLLAVAPAAHADITVIEVRIEEFHDITFFDAVFASDCDDESGYEVMRNGRGFRFYEKDPAATLPLDSEPGYLATGCGTVTTFVPVPPGLERVRLHFEASRTVETYNDDLQAGSDLEQWFDLLDADGRSVHGHHPVFPPDEGGQKMQSIGPLTFSASAAELGQRVGLQWGFRDDGLAPQDQAPNPLSGQAFSGAVQNVIVQLTRMVPVDEFSVSSHESREGTLLTTEYRVRMRVAPGFGASDAPALAVRIAPGTGFHGIVVPGGSLLAGVTTLDDGLVGYSQTQATMQLTPSYMQVTFPRPLVAAYGPGEYTFIFRDTDGVQFSPALVPVAAILLIAPVPFAILAWMESRAFRREAFGRYAASARNLQWGVGLVLAYYVAVVLSAAVGGRIPLMAAWPLELEGWLLHAQVLLAGIAFTGLWLVARELFLIVRPPRSELEQTSPPRRGPEQAGPSRNGLGQSGPPR